MQNDHLRRVADAYKHGDALTKKALTSNSLQKSPTLKEKEVNKGNHNGGDRNGKKNGKAKNQSGDSSTNSSTNSNNNSTRGSSNGGGNNTPSTSGNASVDNKKLKRRLAMAVSCSVCGFECGHSDLDCFKDPTTEENKQAVEKNRKDSKMRDFFKAIDNAKKKRGN